MPISYNQNFRLLQGRLGIYDKYTDPNKVIDNNLTGLNNQQTRLDFQGGSLQQDRMVADKRRSLDRALHFSYQGANVRKLNGEADVVRALINSNKLKPDYDDKIISIGFEHNFAVGDVFEWLNTNTKWIIYLQDLTELAYFKGDIRKCSHEISWEDENGKHTTYAAIRGPVETKIDSASKHNISIDSPNYSLSFMLPKNEDTLKYFQRYSKFYLGETDELKVCWRVEAIDWLSTPGIIEINATEYYRNEIEDDIENGIVGGLIAEPVNPNDEAVEETIKGEAFIKPKKLYTFEYIGNLEGPWSVSSDCNVKLIQRGKFVDVRWLDTYSGEFELIYADKYKKIITVESLF